MRRPHHESSTVRQGSAGERQAARVTPASASMNEGTLSGPRQNVKFALFALSGNECAFPDCDAPVFQDDSIVGAIAHIHAQRPGGPRYAEGLNDDELHGIENLVLLCLLHHKIVDDDPERFDVEWLRRIKREHESRAETTSGQVLRRLVDALAPPVPDDWWRRPGAPVFHPDLSSRRPGSGPWVFTVTIEQIDGQDIGDLRFKFIHGGRAQAELVPPQLMYARKWRLGAITIEPRGAVFEVELQFWWDGAIRSVLFHWETEAHFQKADVDIRRS